MSSFLIPPFLIPVVVCLVCPTAAVPSEAVPPLPLCFSHSMFTTVFLLGGAFVDFPLESAGGDGFFQLGHPLIWGLFFSTFSSPPFQKLYLRDVYTSCCFRDVPFAEPASLDPHGYPLHTAPPPLPDDVCTYSSLRHSEGIRSLRRPVFASPPRPFVGFFFPCFDIFFPS